MNTTMGTKFAWALIGSFFGLVFGLASSLMASMGGASDPICFLIWGVCILIAAATAWKIAL